MSKRMALLAAQYRALAVDDTRGKRFSNRIAGIRSPVFADLAAIPHWLLLPPDQQQHVAAATGLLHYQDALKKELSGTKLASLAKTVGEALIDAVCAIESHSSLATEPLPPPDQLVDKGWRILHQGLPTMFAARFPMAANNAEARKRSETAFDLVSAL
jgi:hypothetical protein